MTTMKPHSSPFLRVLALAVLVLGMLTQSCANEGFGKPRASRRLEVNIIQPAGVPTPVTGTKDQPLGLLVEVPGASKLVTRTSTSDETPFLRRMLRPSTSAPVSGWIAPGFADMRT